MSKRAEEKAIAYQLATKGANVIGGASILSEEEYKFWNINHDFKAGYEQAEKDLGWISVKDRLPDTNDYVLTCYEEFGVPCGVAFHYYEGDVWWEDDTEESACIIEYWMPIPKLPKI